MKNYHLPVIKTNINVNRDKVTCGAHLVNF